MEFREVEGLLRRLLDDFLPERANQRPGDPFVYLQSDGVWHVEWDGQGDPKDYTSSGQLLEFRARGGFTEEVQHLLESDDDLFVDIAQMMLNSGLPREAHRDLLKALGLEIPVLDRDTSTAVVSEFSRSVLDAYGYRCAICGFACQLGDEVVGVEAVHIKRKEAGGTDEVPNGLALCATHSELFTYGVLTLDPSLAVRVSSSAHGDQSYVDQVMRYNGSQIRLPMSRVLYPDEACIEWHAREVFRG
jgi:putative restriction endonuclease